MSVGKGSIKRAAQAKDAVKEVKKEAAVVKEETKTEAVKEAAKAEAPKAPAKKTTAKKPAVVAASVISSDDIHEKKFEAVSKIHCDLPIYLL